MATNNNNRTEKLIAAMLRPEFYSERPARVELRQTHISYVFLAGSHVYKVKKPLQLPFLDYSTLAKRRYFCGEELRLNRRLAPNTYLGMVAIRGHAGDYFLDENDSNEHIVEYAVKMKRLPDERMLSALLRRNAAETSHVIDIADKLVAFHRRADTEKAPIYGSRQAIATHVRGNFRETRQWIGVILSPAIFESIQAYSEAFLSEHGALLDRRVMQRRVCDGHGDLRAEHICMVDGIEIYDCVEFNEALRYSDVASEVGFLAMDLDFAGAGNLSDQFAGAYTAAAGDDDLPALLPFYKCYRAYVRGKVESLKSAAPEIAERERGQAALQALRYYLLAQRYAKSPTAPKLLVVCGMVATGKSTVARLLSARTGFAVFDSDSVRKELAGIAPNARADTAYGRGIYAPAFTARTYDSLLQAAAGRLASGEGAIIAATFAAPEYRRRALQIAERLGVPPLFVECRSDEDSIRQRLQRRESDPDETSDATWAIYERTRRKFQPLSEIPDECHCAIDTERAPLSTIAALEERL